MTDILGLFSPIITCPSVIYCNFKNMDVWFFFKKCVDATVSILIYCRVRCGLEIKAVEARVYEDFWG